MLRRQQYKILFVPYFGLPPKMSPAQDNPKLHGVDLPEVDDFLLYLKTQNYSPETVYNYERDLRQFAVFLEDEKRDFGKTDKLTIMHYKAYLVSRDQKQPFTGLTATIKLDPRSINRNLSSLRNYLKY